MLVADTHLLCAKRKLVMQVLFVARDVNSPYEPDPESLQVRLSGWLVNFTQGSEAFQRHAGLAASIPLPCTYLSVMDSSFSHLLAHPIDQ